MGSILSEIESKKLRLFFDKIVEIVYSSMEYNLSSEETIITHNPIVEAIFAKENISINIYYNSLDGYGKMEIKYKGSKIFEKELHSIEDIYGILE
jgi:hypothetical protein